MPVNIPQANEAFGPNSSITCTSARDWAATSDASKITRVAIVFLTVPHPAVAAIFKRRLGLIISLGATAKHLFNVSGLPHQFVNFRSGLGPFLRPHAM